MYSDNCESHYPILHDQIDNVMGNYIDSTCGDYNPDTDKCEKMPPLPKIDKKLKVKNKFIKNLVNIFESLE